jgi:hypothetical protein
MTVSYRAARALLLVAILSCSGIVLTERSSFADLDDARLSAFVGNHKRCCTKGAKVSCSAKAPFACKDPLVSCSTTQTVSDDCAKAVCNDASSGDRYLQGQE